MPDPILKTTGVMSDSGRPFDEASENLQQSYFNAMPFPAALITFNNKKPVVLFCNQNFIDIASEPKTANLSPWEGDTTVKLHPELVAALKYMPLSQDKPYQFDWMPPGGQKKRCYKIIVTMMGCQIKGMTCYLMVPVDNTQAVELQSTMRMKILRDSLTGLPNRIGFSRLLDDVILLEKGTASVAVIAIDLIRFSRINESMGSVVGDELLVSVARRLTSVLRPGDRLGRIGGDQFGILLSLHHGTSDVWHAARRIKALMSTPFNLANLKVKVNCAIGFSLMDDRIEVSEDLLRDAQIALKRAKETDHVEVYNVGEASVLQKRFSLETDLRRAIDNGDLHLVYQPILSPYNKKIVGFEALARWNHETLGPVSPAEFIPVAEESGLIVPLGRWALESSVHTQQQWDKQAGYTLPIRVSVNVSALQLMRDNLTQLITDIKKQTGINGERLTLELTESALMRYPEQSISVINTMHELGIKISMDDFGTGYSSLSYLKTFPIDHLKIDRSFVTNLAEDKTAIAITRAITSMASTLSIKTIVEGIETPEQKKIIMDLGCDYAQGFYFSRPLPVDEAIAFYMASNRN
ncbi:putative bifunctional diguanylate cyclase/phosphodiesterase [Zymomonas mobilis]|uniref:putative bifunctional diguanylate cyclase/phosphodiesterase n=1 Tax=Zymomonas mobilis TaxID=542 RepID=UPI0003C73ACF|nr:bifunctional diguanylate cyclase/phosphodiesterase [Zymomonas mobilis]AHB09599.1 diguanylate cyclase/phosphodiesterase [Zymomonas mobilis subsp. mobilis str. CP4 = NRRL B-14023]AHJ69904.1 Bacteriophytochrome cph2 [Zymomonas mobilis subsp. mobilis NRRL B-12526]AHJ71759.1 Bacteriophytochrome cph2 [Zymomonas mobilis subsp. mobilis str. CP4 = NRRL B-14023]TWE25178.1 diguanylate cyclase/phosphodiesterase [Zymomonas mobilis]